MLINSGVRLTGGPLRLLGLNNAGVMDRSAWGQSGALRNLYAAEVRPTGVNKAGYPNGYTHPASWSLPTKGGGMSAYRTIAGSGGITTAQLAMGKDLSATFIGSGEITTANLSLIVSFLATLAGSGDLTASMRGAISLAATLAGSGDITAAMGAIIFMNATLSGAGTLNGSNATGLGNMSAEIRSYGDLTPEGLAGAVWSAAAVLNNSTGTMGEKLNDAGSAANPWTEVIESGYTAAQILRLLAAVAAGKTNIVDLGGGNAEVTIRDLADTKDRVVADMVGSERSSLTLDVT